MLFFLAAFILIRLLEMTGHLPGLGASFADDLICLPLVLGTLLLLHRRWGRRGPQFTLPHSHGIMGLVLFSIYFEGILPHWKSTAVADPWDLLMYFAGYLIFEILINRPAGNSAGAAVKTLSDNAGEGFRSEGLFQERMG